MSSSKWPGFGTVVLLITVLVFLLLILGSIALAPAPQTPPLHMEIPL